MGTQSLSRSRHNQGTMKSLVLLLTSALPHLSWGQGVKFGDSSSSTDVDQRFIFGLPSSTGNQFVDGALVGAAAGVIGGVVGKPIVDGVLGGGGCNPNCCGRRKRQTQFGENGDQKFFLPTGNQQCCNGRRKQPTEQLLQPKPVWKEEETSRGGRGRHKALWFVWKQQRAKLSAIQPEPRRI